MLKKKEQFINYSTTTDAFDRSNSQFFIPISISLWLKISENRDSIVLTVKG